jgi:hypothetical protein
MLFSFLHKMLLTANVDEPAKSIYNSLNKREKRGIAI